MYVNEYMDIRIDRLYKKEDYTIGNLYINGEYLCNTLEDKVRTLDTTEDKIYGETAIPEGRYEVILSYSPYFKKILPELLDVPMFKNIRIHAGNDKEDTEGCILVGENKKVGKVINSRKTMKKLMSKIKTAWDNGEKIYINIR